MKYFILYLISFNCLAQEITNECGQTKKEWFDEDIRCFEVRGDSVAESYFVVNSDHPVVIVTEQSVDEFEKLYERAD